MPKFDVSMTTEAKDFGAESILEELSKVGSGFSNPGTAITVGYHKPENERMAKTGKKTTGRQPIGVIADWNEFGTKTQKPRPTLRPQFDKSVNAYVARTQRLLRRLYTGQLKFEKLADLQGKWLRTQLRREIRQFNNPRNDPDWERQKTKDGLDPWPLKATRSMLKATNYRVKMPPRRGEPLSKLFEKVEKDLRRIKL